MMRVCHEHQIHAKLHQIEDIYFPKDLLQVEILNLRLYFHEAH